MFTVIDTIPMTDVLYRHQPGLKAKYQSDGLLAILDPDETTEVPVVSGSVVTIFRPDGSSIVRVVTVAERPSTVVGLFFAGLRPEDVPRLSHIKVD